MTEEKKKIERCFWCGRPKNQEILEETEETLKNSVITNYEPCDRCAEDFKKGIHVIGTTKEPIVEGMFPIMQSEQDTLYPTGSMFVATEDMIKDMLSEDSEKELLKNVLKEKIILLPNDFVEDIINQARNSGNENNHENYIDNVIESFESKETE